MQALPGLVECGALLLIGYNLRSSGLFRTSDGEVRMCMHQQLRIDACAEQGEISLYSEGLCGSHA